MTNFPNNLLPASPFLEALESLLGEMTSQAEVIDWDVTISQASSIAIAEPALFTSLEFEKESDEPIDDQAIPPDTDLSIISEQPTIIDILNAGSPVVSPSYEFRYEVQALSDIVVSLPGFDLVSLIISPQTFYLTFILDETGVSGELTLTMAARFSKSLLTPMRQVMSPQGEIKYEENTDLDYAAIDFGSVTINVGPDGEVQFQITEETHFDYPVMIGASGVIVEIENLQFNPELVNPTFLLGMAKVMLPANFGTPNVDIVIENGQITSQGFSGSIAADLDLVVTSDQSGFVYLPNTPATLLAIPGGLRHLALSFEQNRLTSTDITGSLIIPYFDAPVDIRVNITSAGVFNITLQSDITITKDELLALNIQSLTVGKVGDIAYLTISGGLKPLLMASDGLEWPQLDVKDLSIEQDITDLTKPPIIKFKEAWVDLKDLATLDLWGFHLELNRVGLGFEEARDRLWVDLTGSLRLIEQIPVGLGVEGLRLSWPRDLSAVFGRYQGLELAMQIASQLEVEFDGVYLFFGVPGSIEFEGFLGFIKSAEMVGFRGDMALRVPSTGLAIEAGLMVGINSEAPSPYPFLLLTFGVELPAGIPLAQSGLALKGAQGLFGLNVSPNRTEDQNWYYDWYKRDPLGAHKTSKWQPERNALALGMGLTVTTVDGYVKGVRGLLVLAIPGPVLIIEGRALIFNGLTPAEPPLRALAVIDGKQKIIQFNIEAEAELIADMLEAYGMLEAFFDFNDLTNWHLYLGQDEPRNRRIQANVLKFNDNFLFKADAYLMVDMIGSQTLRSRMGVYVGFKPPIPDFGPVQITFDAVLEGRGEVTILPEQFSGDVDLSANIELKAFGFGFQLTATAGVLTEGPKPFKVDAELTIRADLPDPLEDFEETLQFSWQAPEVPKITPPLVAVTADSPFAPGGGALPIHIRETLEGDQSIWRTAAETSPVAPIDTRPVLSFGHEMNDEARAPDVVAPLPAFARHPDSETKTYDVGMMQFTPTLTAVRLYEHRKGEPWPASLDGWKQVASSIVTEIHDNVAPLPGVWMAEADPQDPGNPPTRRLHLWTNNPLLHAANTLGPGYALPFDDISTGIQQAAGISHAEQLLGLHPDLMKCTDTEPKRICVDFIGAAGVRLDPGIVWEYQGLRFKSITGPASVQVESPPQPTGCLGVVLGVPMLKALWDRFWPPPTERACLTGQDRLSIRFPEPVSEVHIRFCELPKITDNNPSSVIDTARSARTSEELKKITEEAKGKGVAPDPTACRYPVVHQVEVENDTWIISADQGFDCLALFKKEEFAIAEVCYLTVKEKERAARAAVQCETNPRGDAEPQNILRPGSYYRLEVETTVSGELLVNPEDLLEPVYKPILEALGLDGDKVPHKRVAFFQTEGPPTSLARYIKWSNPQHQAARFFRNDDFAIRFLRPNMEEMYAHQPHKLEMLIRSAEGRLIDGYDIDWGKAGSASLLHEEQLWRDHRPDVGLPNTDVEADDVLQASRVSAELEPNARYELLVTGGEGGALLFQDDFNNLSDEWKPDVIGWTAQAGVLTRQNNGAYITTGNPNWTDLDLTMELKLTNRFAGGVLVRADSTLKQDDNPVWNACRVSLSQNNSGMFLLRLHALQRDPASGGSVVSRLLHLRTVILNSGLWTRLRICVVANRLRVWLFDTLVIDGMLYQVVRDWTTLNRSPGTLLYSDNGALSAERRDALQRGDLLPSTQGQVGLYAAGAGPEFRRMRVRDAVLQRVSFTTSAFAGFRQLLESGKTNLTGPGNTYAPISVTVAVPIEDIAQAISQAFTDQTTAKLPVESWAWHCAQIDYRFETLDRKGLEERKLALREAHADHDAAFRTLAEAVASDMYYLPIAPHIELYLLRNEGGQVLGLWLRSPESLELWQDVDENNHVGRTRISLTQEAKIFHDADSSQILIFRENNAEWPSALYNLTFAYHRNHEDEAGAGDHRYDRQVEMSGGSTDIETVPITFTI